MIIPELPTGFHIGQPFFGAYLQAQLTVFQFGFDAGSLSWSMQFKMHIPAGRPGRKE